MAQRLFSLMVSPLQALKSGLMLGFQKLIKRDALSHWFSLHAQINRYVELLSFQVMFSIDQIAVVLSFVILMDYQLLVFSFLLSCVRQ